MDGINITLKVEGLSELESTLERMPRQAAKAALRTGLAAGAAVWAAGMRARVRQGWHHGKGKHPARNFGLIAKNIVTRTTVKSDLEGVARVGPGNGTFWDVFEEFGTRTDPGHPFIRSEWETDKERALEEFAAATKVAIEAAGMKLS